MVLIECTSGTAMHRAPAMGVYCMYHRRYGSICPSSNTNGVVDMSCHVHRPRMYAMRPMLHTVPASSDRVLSDTPEHCFIYGIMLQPTGVQALAPLAQLLGQFARPFQSHLPRVLLFQLIVMHFLTNAYCVWSHFHVRKASFLPW